MRFTKAWLIFSCLFFMSCDIPSMPGDPVAVVAVGRGGTLRTSPDGDEWTLERTGVDADFKSVAAIRAPASEGGALALAASSVFDGVNPTHLYAHVDGQWAVTHTVSTLYSPINRLSYAGGTFVALCGIDQGMILESTDGSEWRAPMFGGDGMYAVSEGDGKLVAAGEGDRILVRDAGGGAWVEVRADGGSPKRFYGMAFGNGRFVAVGVAGDLAYARWATSPDGETWENETVDPDRVLLSDVAFGESAFVAVGYKIVMSSADGITWVDRLRRDVHFSSVTFTNNTFIACGVSTLDGTSVLEVSDDGGVTWREIDVDSPQDCILDVEAVRER